MRKIWVSLLCILALAGCAGANTSLNTLQVSGAEEAFPADYQLRAQRYLTGQESAGVMVSYPRTVVGETAFSARRWYVCLTGLPPNAPQPDTLRPLLSAAFDRAESGATEGVYTVILILRPGGSTSALMGYDSPLCADGSYEALAAG